MIRQIIHIDEEKCNGCGLCAKACHEGAIDIIDGKARLVRENFCDGFGDCLPGCPMNAITFEKREAPAYDEVAVEQVKAKKGSVVVEATASESLLSNWPVQIRLAPLKSAGFDNRELLVAADCTAFACADFHKTFIQGRVTLVGCPKLDDVDYSIKLKEIIRNNSITVIRLVKMEVPCCSGLERAVVSALEASGKKLPLSVVTLSTKGEVLEDRN